MSSAMRQVAAPLRAAIEILVALLCRFRILQDTINL
jgi:hypothetical protein